MAIGLPVYVIDEDIYEKRPSLVIGTVDRIAILAWRSEARAIFGIGPGGQQESSPPGLIIQDDLYLARERQNRFRKRLINSN